MATRHTGGSHSRPHLTHRPRRSRKIVHRHRQMRHPEVRNRSRMANLGAIALGAGGVAAATIFGVGELTVGFITAYVAYRAIRYGITPTEAVIEGVELEHGEVPKKEAKAA